MTSLPGNPVPQAHPEDRLVPRFLSTGTITRRVVAAQTSET
jgi:hypothetical protein